ncbi:NAD(P)/FAD-dependent oxidoreductase [Haloechinothrix sp. YIM 98757]|uniref:NAD(P)/FAD-dependent oxidoreductase n=1 Tax=Haloechinothrix aidingensis TaxID=2752311 RepID=A0A838AF64_9PSEU|nr:NAD(P)/FAD-dependent oxidoreductase [Haloechinothrix aidingensis]MBA0127768.1 NAD(P)/FAD-dependent oxidoreductase [Haloechinothrix aidingensis]
MTETSAGHLPEQVRIAIVGSGFSGLGMAIRLKQAGIHDFVVLERRESVGGTWNDNTYPNCGCDVPSHLYSFSFAPKPDWSRTYSNQPEIWRYLADCAEEFGVTDYIRYGVEVRSAAWDSSALRWQVTTDSGTLSAQVVISAMGPLNEPRYPDIEGLDSFQGTMFHSARWNHEHDLRGKRVASVGTGASAIQYVPAIAPDVEQLYVFQRTAPWVVPHTDRPLTEVERRLYRSFPPLQRLARAGVYVGRELMVPGFVKYPKLMRGLEWLALGHMRRQLRDPELRRKATPDYTLGCKRILPSNAWYPALERSNVELVTGGVREIRANSVVGSDGTEYPVDTIVFGTGFHVTDMPAAHQVYGRAGRRLDEMFRGSPRAYLGTTFAGFPNMFMMLGPNTGLGHTSMVYMIESQISYILGALREMNRRDAHTIEVRADVQEGFNSWVDSKMQPTVWQTGCSSWYLDSTGRNATLWPDWTWRYRHRMARFEPSDYEFTVRSPRERAGFAGVAG